jgi:hypothetical protein
MRIFVVGLVGSLLLSTAVGCGTDEPRGDDTTEVGDLTGDSFPGTYEPATSGDDDFFGTVKVVKQGTRLSIELDGESHPLSRTPTGAFVFTHDEGLVVNPCDDPGCGDIIKISGVVFLKNAAGGPSQPQVKLTVTQEFSHPESEGDPEGEVKRTVRWVKKR